MGDPERDSGGAPLPVTRVRGREDTAPSGVDPAGATLPSAPAFSRSDSLVGVTLGHFRVEAPLGAGGMGTVYRAVDTSLDRPVALKVLHVDRPDTRARFLREARAQARIRHPNVVPIHFIGEDRGVVFLAMELVEGESLGDRIARTGPMDPDEALHVVDRVAAALESAHALGMVHRDVKPTNVLIGRDGRVLLADFGLAKRLASAEEARDGVATPAEGTGSGEGPAGGDAHNLTAVGAIVGTPAYMAPEQTTSAEVDHRADMYALGVTFYEAVTGEPPFAGESTLELLAAHREAVPPSPRAAAPNLRPQLEAVILRLLEKEPARRYDDYAALRAALAEARSRTEVPAGFFVRGLASFTDLVVLGVLAGLAAIAHDALFFPLLVVLFGVAEARFGTTPGKRLFRISTEDRHGERLRVLPAIGRSALKVWGLMVASTADSLLEEGVVQTVVQAGPLVIWCAGLLLAAGGQKRAFHDRVFGTRVVYALRA